MEEIGLQTDPWPYVRHYKKLDIAEQQDDPYPMNETSIPGPSNPERGHDG